MLSALGKRLIIQPVEDAKGPLIVTNTKPKKFAVITVGDEITRLKAGDVIYLERHCGAEVEHLGQKYFVIDEGQVLAKVD